ncbi:hypothetical protein Tco_1510942 [Tanacetum coccineum]
METIHVTFDELTAMASEQLSSGSAPQQLTPRTLSLGLCEILLLQHLILADPTSSHVSTSIEQDAPYASTSSNQEQEQSLIISKSVKEQLQSVQFKTTPFQDTPSEKSY